MYYAYIKQNKINGKGKCKILNKNIVNIPIKKDIYDNLEQYIYQENNIIENPNYEVKQK